MTYLAHHNGRVVSRWWLIAWLVEARELRAVTKADDAQKPRGCE